MGKVIPEIQTVERRDNGVQFTAGCDGAADALSFQAVQRIAVTVTDIFPMAESSEYSVFASVPIIQVTESKVNRGTNDRIQRVFTKLRCISSGVLIPSKIDNMFG